uniref:Uncharacterized protein n=1 Tax=viral metagenome TaxID=1070528 RepID=A0A6C0HNS6_9ZZZZ
MKVKRSKNIKSRRTKVKATGGGLMERIMHFIKRKKHGSYKLLNNSEFTNLPSTLATITLNNDTRDELWPNMTNAICSNFTGENKIEFFKNNPIVILTLIEKTENKKQIIDFDDNTLKTLSKLYHELNPNPYRNRTITYEIIKENYNRYITEIYDAFVIDMENYRKKK